MTYSRNFGFRSFENIVRNGRHRVKAAETLKNGAGVKLDANGEIVAAVSADAPSVGTSGLALYEQIDYAGVDAVATSPEDLDDVPAGNFAQMVSGNGVKVWLKASMFEAGYDFGATAVGDPIGIGATGLYDDAGANPTWLIVEQFDATVGAEIAECRIAF